MNLTDQALVSDNGIGGVLGRFGAFITVFRSAVITFKGATTLVDPTERDSFFLKFQSGIAADFGSTVLIRGNNSEFNMLILENGGGPGLLLSNNSTAELQRLRIQRNNGGVIVQRQSVAQLLDNVTVSVNNKVDLLCDQSSLLHGDFTHVDKDRCNNTSP